MQQFTLELQQLLSIITNGQTALVNTATATLNSKYYKTCDCIPSLVDISTNPANPIAIKQLAAIECRKQLKKASGKHWDSLPIEARNNIKNTLLQYILVEQDTLVRHSLARVISEAAKNELPHQRWSDLITFLYSCCNSPQASHREIGVYVLYTLFEVIADHLAEHLNELFQLFVKTLGDPESHQVRITTLLALGKIAEFIEPTDQEQIKLFRNIIPAMVNVLQQCLDANDMDGATKSFEVFDNLLILEAPLLSVHFADLVQFYISVSSNRNYEDSIRVMALSFLMWCTVYKKSKLQKLRLVETLLSSSMAIGTEGDEHDSEDSDDSPSKISFQVINSLSTNLPPAQVFPEAMKHITSFMQQENPSYRKSAMFTISVLVDGCSEHMRTRMDQYFPLICHGLQDSELVVRKAACIALGAIADCIEEITEHHQTLLPLISNLMNDSDHSIHYNAICALDAIVEGLGDDIMPYLPNLMGRLITLLENGDRKLKVVVTASIGSAAHAAQTGFSPYFTEVMSRLSILMTLGENKDDLELRAVATDTVSAIAEAVGKDLFRPNVQSLMHLCISGLSLDNSRLRECSYCFFAVLARVFEEEFAPFLTVIVPHILNSCKIVEKDLLSTEEGLEEFSAQFAVEDEDSANDNGYSINSAIAEEKETSLDALANLFSATRSAFMPYVTDSINISLELLEHYHESVRKSAVSCLFSFLKTFYKMSSPQKWICGLPLHVVPHENVSNLTKLVVEGVLKALADEDDRLTVSETFNEFTDALKLMGPCLLSGTFSQPSASYLETFISQLLDILKREHVCQCDQEMDDVSQDDDDQAEQDMMVISSAVDSIGALSAAIGPEFSVYFTQFLPLISKYYKPQKPDSDRNMAIGSLAETAEGLGAGVTQFTNELLALFVKALSDDQEEVQSNASFGIGIICANSQLDLTGSYMQILNQLRPFFDSKDSKTNINDNACGAVARMIMRSPGSVPLEHVLPLFLENLPLKKDFQENEPVYKCIFGLLKSNNSYLMGKLPELINIFAQILEPKEQLSDMTRKEVLEYLHSLQMNHGDNFNQVLTGLKEGYASTIITNLR